MKAASSNEIKLELKKLSSTRLVELCLRLARFKKENKELLTFLLFEADDEASYITNVKSDMDEGFNSLNRSSIYLAKKTIRKVLRTANKYIRFTGSKVVEVELLIHFCQLMLDSDIRFQKSNALLNLYNSQLKKIREAIAVLHEDLQYDYLRQVEILELKN